MKNLENIKLVLDKIENNPECWDQTQWHCGTSHCFAGWAQVLSGKEEDDATVRSDARLFFGFNNREASYYFDGYRTLNELKTSLLNFYDENGYDLQGYDKYGYDAQGFDSIGLNKEGFDCDGYDCNGYDRDGYDRDGYDEDGFDKDNKYKISN